MNKVFGAMLVFSFITLAAFGFSLMNHGESHTGCIAAEAQSGDCPKNNNPAAFVAFHLDAFKKFSSAIFSIFLPLLFIAFGFISPQFALGNFPSLFSHYGFSEANTIFTKKKLNRWLALHENSPSFVV